MKVIPIIAAMFVITLIFSCGKKSTTPPAGPVAGTVTIEGGVYPTISIGNQIWTTQNFSGAATDELFNTQGNVATYGNYYSDINGITLPAGWRVPTRADYNQLLSNYTPVFQKYSDGDIYFGFIVTQGLNSQTGWQKLPGTNASGFNALPAGFAIFLPFSVSTAYPESNGDAAYFLTSDTYTFYDTLTGKNDNMTYALEISDAGNVIPFETENYSGITHITNDDNGMIIYASLRFVKDK